MVGRVGDVDDRLRAQAQRGVVGVVRRPFAVDEELEGRVERHDGVVGHGDQKPEPGHAEHAAEALDRRHGRRAGLDVEEPAHVVGQQPAGLDRLVGDRVEHRRAVVEPVVVEQADLEQPRVADPDGLDRHVSSPLPCGRSR